MTAPRFYSWDDDGSPGRALSGNLQNRLKQILVPCLVTGYGSKPGAGWTVGHEHANGFSLLNADGNVVNFVSNLPAQAPYPAMNANAVHIYAAESLTDTSNAVIGGANLCSGPYRAGFADSSGYPRHAVHLGSCLISQLTNLQWTIVADQLTAVISFSADRSGNGSSGSTTERHQGSIYLGGAFNDLGIPSALSVLGGENVNYNADPMPYTFSKGFTAPRNLVTGLAEYSVFGAQPFLNKFNDYNRAYIEGYLPANVLLQSPRILSNYSYAGRLRGAVYDDVLAVDGWPIYLKSLGLSGTDFAGRGKVVSIGSYQYAYAMGYNGGFIMTNDPAFW